VTGALSGRSPASSRGSERARADYAIIPVAIEYDETQLDALRELANIGAGTAATALSQMLGQEVEISVPHVHALPLAEAVAAAGPPEQVVTSVAIPLEGDLDAVVLLLIPPQDAETLCSLLGVEADTDVGASALSEIGNILGASYMNALAAVTGLSLILCPPQLATDMLSSVVATVLAEAAGSADTTLLLDTSLDLPAHPCSLSFMLVPISGSVSTLLAPLGLA
jgi:chemotaxis protein CheC